jgi:ribosomal protein S18 acetylase RimI-like enzyme
MTGTVTESNTAAVALYESCGFLRFGAEPLAVAVGSDYVTKLHMWQMIDSEQRT